MDASSFASFVFWGGCGCVVTAAVPVLLLWVWTRVSALGKRVETLETQLRETERQLAELQRRPAGVDATRVAETIRAAVVRATAAAGTPAAPGATVAPGATATASPEAPAPRPTLATVRAAAAPPVDATASRPASASTEAPPAPSTPAPAPADATASRPAAKPSTPTPPLPPLPPLPEVEPPSFLRTLLLGGNAFTRLGAGVLFLGLAFLLRLAAERIHTPIEVRYAGVAAVGVGLVALGWWARERRPAFGLLIQGTGVGVLYLTIFAAIRVHELLPPTAGLLLLVSVAGLAGTLAVLQDAMALAVAGTLGGFAAPILASTGGEHHVGLFTYLLVLNGGVLGIAWFKAWRPLNLLGFVGTFGIGAAWGATAWRPEHTATTEPFLAAFFLIYVAVPTLFARRRLLEWQPDGELPPGRGVLLLAARASSALDGTLLFGTPIVAFGLHARMVKDIEDALAFSALGLGAFYLALAAVVLLRSGRRLLLLGEVFLSIGVVFASLAVPLALEPRWTSVAWALEGAGIFWIASRQGRPVGRVFALLLQLGAVIGWMRTLTLPTDTVLGASWLGATILGVAGLIDYASARAVREAPPEGVRPPGRFVEGATLLAGLGFLALVPPTLLDLDGTALAWAGLGLLFVEGGRRVGEPLAQGAGVFVQLFAGLAFLGTLRPGQGGPVLAGGPRQLGAAALVGGAAVLSGGSLRPRGVARSVLGTAGASVVYVAGLGILNLGVCFVLPAADAPLVWAVSGVAAVWVGLTAELPAVTLVGLALEGLAGCVNLGSPPLRDAGAPFTNEAFAIPLVIATAGWVASWRMLRTGRGLAGAAETFGWLLTLWGAAWWTYGWGAELRRVVHVGAPSYHLLVAVTAVSACGWATLARRLRWPAMAGIAALPLPMGVFVFGLGLANGGYTPFADYGAVAWPALFVAHFGILYALSRPGEAWGEATASTLHRFGLWLLLALGATGAARLSAELGDADSAWRWLGWAAVPGVWLVLVARAPLPFWPFTELDRLYRRDATLPVVLWLLGWISWTDLVSPGSAAPLPYVPFLNPLELSHAGLGLAVFLWGRERLAAEERVGMDRLVAAVLFAAYTGVVARTAHQVWGVPWTVDAMLDAPVFQAGLSLAWIVWALTQMVLAHRSGRRGTWLIGAALTLVVVVKLFLVELADTGSLTRIVSFLGVGAGLLLVGWFAPMPPRRPAPPPDEPASPPRSAP